MTTLDSALAEFRNALATVRLGVEVPGATRQRQTAAAVVKQLDDYILPRLAAIEAPLLAVVGGSTGAGKSTLVNSLLGRQVSAPGVVRPTTRAPVLVHHSSDSDWFSGPRVLPGLARSTGTATGTNSLQLVRDDSIPPGLAILDAPDIDSVVTDNRTLAAQLLAAADLWLFVTSAARYADAVPWGFLLSAAQRNAAVAVVLDRVPPRAMAEVPAHLGRLMAERGLGQSPLFAVPETEVDDEGLLPAAAVRPIRSWLGQLAVDQAGRAAVVRQTLHGAIAAAADCGPAVAAALDTQRETLEQLTEQADQSYAEATRTVRVQTADGTLLRGEVLARWQEFVGTGEFFRALEEKVGWLRDRVTAALKGQPHGAGDLKVAVSSGLEALLQNEADAAAERVAASWLAHPVGRQLLEDAQRAQTGGPSSAAAKLSAEALGRATADFPDRAAHAIREWQGAVLELVSGTGMAKRSKARFLAFGVNGVGAALMIVVFAQTGGVTGAEIGIAGGTTILAQRVLEAVFGDQAVRELADTAKTELDDRVETLFAEELLRYHQLVDGYGEPESLPDRILRAAEAVNDSVAADAAVTQPDVIRPVPVVPVQPVLGEPEIAGYVRSVGSETRELPAQAEDLDIVDAELVAGAADQEPEPDARRVS